MYTECSRLDKFSVKWSREVAKYCDWISMSFRILNESLGSRSVALMAFSTA